MTHREEQIFKTSIAKVLRARGAVPGASNGYDYTLKTPLGLLYLTVYEDWIATRFADLEAAKAGLPDDLRHHLNIYSGKWNHHYLSNWSARDAVADFDRVLGELLSLSLVEA